MKDIFIDGEKYISEINLFGTHDSLTAFVSMEKLSRCQSLTLSEQLALGVRLIDVRLRKSKDEFFLIHSLADCYTDESKKEKMKFSCVLEECERFLKENPREFIVMSVKQDRGIQNRFFFPAFYRRYIEGRENLWLLSDRIPRVEECRGRIVLMRRCKVFGGFKRENPCGLDFSNWKDQGSSRKEKLYPVILNKDQKAVVQDRYAIEPERKWKKCEKPFLDSCRCDENNICLHYISTAYHYKNETLVKTAKEMNGYFKDYDLGEGKGWFFFDFPDKEIADKFRNSQEV